jgi:hypothetical protein
VIGSHRYTRTGLAGATDIASTVPAGHPDQVLERQMNATPGCGPYLGGARETVRHRRCCAAC